MRSLQIAEPRSEPSRTEKPAWRKASARSVIDMEVKGRSARRRMAALEKLPRINEYVFSSRSGTGHLGRDVITKRLKYFKQGTTVHGFRAMGRTYFADKGVRFEVAEACLAHQEKSAVVRAYSRTDYFEERKQVMADWNEYVWKCLAEDEDKKAPDRMAGQTL